MDGAQKLTTVPSLARGAEATSSLILPDEKVREVHPIRTHHAVVKIAMPTSTRTRFVLVVWLFCRPAEPAAKRAIPPATKMWKAARKINSRFLSRLGKRYTLL